MKLNKIIYGILCLTTLNACSDQMEYKEYSNYGVDYVHEGKNIIIVAAEHFSEKKEI